MRKFFTLFVSLSAVGLACLSGSVFAGTYNSVISIGDTMPQFSNLPATDGSTLSSSDLDKKVTVLVSLANHCPWVKGGDQDLIALVDQFKGQDVEIVGFAVNHRRDDRLPAMIEHAEAVGYNFTYVFDESQDIGRQLGATRTPEYFVFDENKELVYTGLLHNSPGQMRWGGNVKHINGEPSDFYTADAVQAALNGNPVPVAETRPMGCTVEYES